MSRIINNNGNLDVFLVSDYEKRTFDENGIQGMNLFSKDSPYDLMKDNDSFYSSFRDGNNYNVLKVGKVFFKDELLYEDKLNNPNSFNYQELLKSYNKVYLKDIEILNETIYNLNENKELFKELFNKNSSPDKPELYRNAFINMINDYKELILKESTPYEFFCNISKFKCINDDNIDFKQNGFHIALNDFEDFVTGSIKNNMLKRFEDKVIDLENKIDFDF